MKKANAAYKFASVLISDPKTGKAFCEMIMLVGGCIFVLGVGGWHIIDTAEIRGGL